MTFDLNLSILSASIGVPDLSRLQPGEEPSVEISLVVPAILPFTDQHGQPAIAPLGKVRFAFGRDQAVDFFRSALEAAERLPKGSNLMIADNLNAVEAAAERLKRVSGNG